MDETPAESSEVQSFHFPDFGNNVDLASAVDSASNSAINADGERGTDRRSRLRIEYGRTEVLRSTVAEWQDGSTIVLPEEHGDPVSVVVDGQPIARGDLVEVDGKLGVRIVELILGANTTEEDARRSA